MAEHVHPIHGKPIGWIYDQPVYMHRDRTGAEIMRRRGLPTAQDLREQYWRRIAQGESPAAAAAAARETAAAAEEVDNENLGRTTEEVNNLNPCATASTIGGSQIAVSQDWTILPSTTWVVHRQGGFSRITMFKNSNPVKTYLSGTGADLEGKSLLKDLGGTSGTVDGSLNPVANLTSASSASTTQVIERGGGSSLNKDLGESSGTTLFDLSGTRADLKGKSLPKDLDESSETVDGYMTSAANLTSASSGTRVEMKRNTVLKRPRKDLGDGESNKSIVKFLNLAVGSSAATIIASATEAELEGESVRKRPRTDPYLSSFNSCRVSETSCRFFCN